MKSPPFCAIINLLDYDSTERGFFMSRKNPAKNINIGLLAHVDAGKTTLSEALLYATGQIRALGRVDHQDAFLDTDAQERARGITIFSKQARLRLQMTDENLHSEQTIGLTILDTPGHVDFSAEMERTLQVLDYAILVISGTDGVQGHTRTLWRLLRHYNIPTFLFVNKMDLPGADKEVVLIPHATGMAFHQILLQGAEFIRRDILITQGTKACRDAVKRLALCLDLPVQIIAATLDAFLHFRGQFQLHISGQYLFDTFERQRFRPHIMYISHNFLLSIFNFQLSIAPASNPATSFSNT